jgi:predicted nucleotidyltransferase
MISSFNFKQSALNPWIKTMVDRIVEGFHPIQIILFGSYARGEATAHSDVDLLVVFPELSSKREMTISIRRILADLPMAKDIVVTTPAEIEEYGDLVGRVLRPALREGKVLYERSK